MDLKQGEDSFVLPNANVVPYNFGVNSYHGGGIQQQAPQPPPQQEESSGYIPNKLFASLLKIEDYAMQIRIISLQIRSGTSVTGEELQKALQLTMKIQ